MWLCSRQYETGELADERTHCRWLSTKMAIRQAEQSKNKSKTRYWYVGLGCTVMVAALYLIKAISETEGKAEVRLFEGFVSFKEKGSKSNHSRDVELLREVVEDCSSHHNAIVEAQALRIAESDTLKSAFLVAGINAGVPPIIMRNG